MFMVEPWTDQFGVSIAPRSCAAPAVPASASSQTGTAIQKAPGVFTTPILSYQEQSKPQQPDADLPCRRILRIARQCLFLCFAQRRLLSAARWCFFLRLHFRARDFFVAGAAAPAEQLAVT